MQKYIKCKTILLGLANGPFAKSRLGCGCFCYFSKILGFQKFVPQKNGRWVGITQIPRNPNLGQSFGVFCVEFGTFGSCWDLDFLRFGCPNLTQNSPFF